MTTPLLSVTIEGCDENDVGQVGETLSLVMEGVLPDDIDPKGYEILIAPENRTSGKNGAPSTALRLSVADFLEEGGPFLCQIDFTPEAVGLMVFNVLLREKGRILANVLVGVRIVNRTRDASGRRRTGSLRKVKG
jgi:hypothetical protein